MPSLAQIDLGFRTAYRVTFERILPAPGLLDATLPPVPIATIVPVSSPFFEADIRVDMDATEAGNGFEMTVHGLGDDIYGLPRRRPSSTSRSAMTTRTSPRS